MSLLGKRRSLVCPSSYSLGARACPFDRFLTLGGFADFMLPTVLGGKAHGAIMGLGNVYPHALAELYYGSADLLNETPRASLAEMTRLQGLASEADWAFVAAGIAGTKYYLQQTRGYGGVCRLPILPFPEDKGAKLLKDDRVNQFMEVEKKLEAQAKGSKVNGSTNGH